MICIYWILAICGTVDPAGGTSEPAMGVSW